MDEKISKLTEQPRIIDAIVQTSLVNSRADNRKVEAGPHQPDGQINEAGFLKDYLRVQYDELTKMHAEDQQHEAFQLDLEMRVYNQIVQILKE